MRGSLFQNQREFYLQEQLKAIHRELGQDDADDVMDLERQIEARKLPEAVKTRALREVRKLRRMSPLSPESTVARNFVDWILALPWTERTDDVLDVAHARRILDEDHYGLEEVKDRILDYIGVLSLVERMEGPILCLVGPPGVGKTSLGRSIARALGRKFVRMSLGGVRDEAEIRGHRRTYIGSMPGRVIQAMRRAEVVNPVILLDEIDKLGQDYRGDPAAALLEVLDPEQNKRVQRSLSRGRLRSVAGAVPHDGELPAAGAGAAARPDGDHSAVRLSRPGEVRHRAAVSRAEAAEAERRRSRDGGVGDRRDPVDRAGVYARGRRARARAAHRPHRAQARAPPRRGGAVSQAAANGRRGTRRARPSCAPMTSRRCSACRPTIRRCSASSTRSASRPGLAYTSVGGEVLEIEVSVVGGRGKLQLTGTLGDVMKESASAALSYARTRAGVLGIDREFYRNRDLHVHIPTGATPKDGPSAGIAIATAIVSALTGIPVRGDVAMTGEITLRGRVLAIGGLKEKAVAAHRNAVRHVLIPHQNARDVEELPEEVRERHHVSSGEDDG